MIKGKRARVVIRLKNEGKVNMLTNICQKIFFLLKIALNLRIIIFKKRSLGSKVIEGFFHVLNDFRNVINFLRHSRI